METKDIIVELRKKNGLSQDELAEKVFVTRQAVSRWETGTYLPPADVLLNMSELFGVSINELLSGKRLTEDEYKQAAEDNLQQTLKASSFSLKDKIEFYKKKWLKEHIAIMIFIGICIMGVFISGLIMRKISVIYSAILLLVLAHGWRNNTMMAYVENNAYDDCGGK